MVIGVLPPPDRLVFFKVRKESDDPHLQGLGDIDGTPRAGVLAGYRSRWFCSGGTRQH